jgi:hypothetical protein
MTPLPIRVRAWTRSSVGARRAWEPPPATTTMGAATKRMRVRRGTALPADSKCPGRCVARIAWRCWTCLAGRERGRCRDGRRCGIARRARGRRVRTRRRGTPRQTCVRGRAGSSLRECRTFVPSGWKAVTCDVALRGGAGKKKRLLTFLIFSCTKKRGYPDCIASMTRASPSSYPTLSTHFGSETEIACSVKAGIELPRGISEEAMGSEEGRAVDAR